MALAAMLIGALGNSANAANPSLVNSKVWVDPTTVERGGTISVNYTVRNPNSSPIDLFFGATIISTTGQEISDPAGDVTRTVAANSTQTISRTFKIPSNAAAGVYTMRGAIWKSLGGTRYDAYDRTGLKVTAPATPPDMRVRIDGKSISDGASYSLGSTYIGSAVTRTLTIYNDGGQNLAIQFLTRGPDHPDAFSHSSLSANPISPGGQATLTVTLLATAEGTFNSRFAIASNDPDGAYEIKLTGTVTRPFQAPSLVNSKVWVDPTTVERGGTISVNYTVRNPNSSPIDLFFGATIISTTGQEISDPAGDVTRTVAANSTQTISRTFKIPSNAAAGVYTMRGAIWKSLGGTRYDAYDRTGLTVTAAPSFQAPSLVNSKVWVDPTTVERGGTISVNYTVRNPNSSPIDLFLGATIISPSGKEIHDPANDQIHTISGNKTQTVVRSFRVPSNAAAGTYTVRGAIWSPSMSARYDAYDRTGLTVTSTPTFQAPALVNSKVWFDPSSVERGGTITVSYSVNNPNSTAIDLFFGATLIGPSGQEISDPANDVIRSIPANAMQTIARSFKVPSNAAAGAYAVRGAIWSPSMSTRFDSSDRPGLTVTAASVDDGACRLRLEAPPPHSTAVTTVIVHGLTTESGGPPPWAIAMGEAILKRAGVGGKPMTYDPSTGKWKGRAPQGTGSPLVLVFDWTEESDNLQIAGYAEAAADALFASLMDPLALSTTGTQSAIEGRQVHLIGFSRGTSVVSELAQRLGHVGVTVDHVTTLDPIWAQKLLADPVPQFWSTVGWFENYYKPDPGVSAARQIAGTVNVPLDGLGDANSLYEDVAALIETEVHSLVHTWYLGTIDLGACSEPREEPGDVFEIKDSWYTLPANGIGYRFSQIGGDPSGRSTKGISRVKLPEGRNAAPSVFNGEWPDGVAGWAHHGGTLDRLEARIPNLLELGSGTHATHPTGRRASKVRHNRMWLPEGWEYFKFTVSARGTLDDNAQLYVRIFPAFGQGDSVTGQINLNEISGLQEVLLEMPSGAQGRAVYLEFEVIGENALATISRISFTDESGTALTFEDAPNTVGPDIDKDGIVGMSDFVALVQAWGSDCSSGCDADINADGVVDRNDLLVLLEHYGLNPSSYPKRKQWKKAASTFYNDALGDEVSGYSKSDRKAVLKLITSAK